MTDSKQQLTIISSASASVGKATDALEEIDSAEFEVREGLVPLESHGARMDIALAQLVPEFSRSYLQQIVLAGGVTLNGSPVIKPATKMKVFDRLRIELKPTAQSQAFKAESMALDVVFEDKFLLVINKPAGLVVHPAPGNWSGTLLNGLLARDPLAMLLPRAGIVHRLDKDTSGLMVVARERQVMDRLVEMIAARTVSRQYLSVAQGAWTGAKTRHVALPVGRDPKNRLRMAVVDLEKTSGKTAATDMTLIDSSLKHCLVQCRLHTGRTHQIRVHMSAIGHPLVSDALYGGAADGGIGRQALHACRLAFEHPVTAEKLEFISPLPADMAAAVVALGLRYN